MKYHLTIKSFVAVVAVASFLLNIVGCADESQSVNANTSSNNNGVTEQTPNSNSSAAPSIVTAGQSDSNHATIQQRFAQHPMFQFFQSRGDAHDFNTVEADQFRSFLTGSMVTFITENTNLDTFATQTTTRRMVFCPGGKFVVSLTHEDSFFQADTPSELNPFISSENTMVRAGYWDVSTFSGVNEEGVPKSGLMISNMVNVSDALVQQAASQGISVPFPSAGQPDVVFDQYLLTDKGEALRINDLFLVLVEQFSQGGVVQSESNLISERTAAPDVCG